MNLRFISTNLRFEKSKRRFVFTDYQVVTRTKSGIFEVGIFFSYKVTNIFRPDQTRAHFFFVTY